MKILNFFHFLAGFDARTRRAIGLPFTWGGALAVIDKGFKCEIPPRLEKRRDFTSGVGGRAVADDYIV